MNDQIYNMLQSGIPLETIYALLGLQDSQIKELENDAEFNRKIKFYTASYESNLLDRLERVMDINECKGISTEIRWLLSRRFSDRYGSKQVIMASPGVLPPPTVGILPDIDDDDTDNDPSDNND